MQMKTNYLILIVALALGTMGLSGVSYAFIDAELSVQNNIDPQEFSDGFDLADVVLSSSEYLFLIFVIIFGLAAESQFRPCHPDINNFIRGPPLK